MGPIGRVFCATDAGDGAKFFSYHPAVPRTTSDFPSSQFPSQLIQCSQAMGRGSSPSHALYHPKSMAPVGRSLPILTAVDSCILHKQLMIDQALSDETWLHVWSDIILVRCRAQRGLEVYMKRARKPTVLASLVVGKDCDDTGKPRSECFTMARTVDKTQLQLSQCHRPAKWLPVSVVSSASASAPEARQSCTALTAELQVPRAHATEYLGD